MGPRRIWKAWRKLRARQHLLGGTVGMSVLVAASSALGQTPAQNSARAPTRRRGQTPGPPPRPSRFPGSRSAPSAPGATCRATPACSGSPTTTSTSRSRSTIVTQDLMREQAAFNLRDALRNVTGISLQAGEGGGGQGDNLSLRGFPARNGHLPRRRPRHRPVQPRRLQPRAGRGPEGPLGRLLRPRVDGRRHQPGEQDAAEPSASTTAR